MAGLLVLLGGVVLGGPPFEHAHLPAGEVDMGGVGAPGSGDPHCNASSRGRALCGDPVADTTQGNRQVNHDE